MVEPAEDRSEVRRDAGRMNDTEWGVREVTVPCMKERIGSDEFDADKPSNEDVEDEGESGGVGILLAVGVDEDEADGSESGGSSIFVYGINALGA